jgi:hypothetical protein
MKQTVLTCILFIYYLSIQAQSYIITGKHSSIKASSHQLEITALPSRTTKVLLPQLYVISAIQDPQLAIKSAEEGRFPHMAWKTGNAAETDLFKAFAVTTLKASGVKKLASNHLQYVFEEQKNYVVTLDVLLPATEQAPVFRTNLQVKEKGWYSTAFAGIQQQDTSDLKFLYQPLVWSWRRFPGMSYMTPESYATTAATFVNNGTVTEGVCPAIAEIPYRFAKWTNSRFGLVLRNQQGKAQPMVWAPIPGSQESLMQPGQRYSFSTRYILHGGDWYAGLNYILRDLFQYRNERRNNAVTLNQTLDNMIRFAMNDVYAGWVDSLKGFDYVQDAIGTVKIVSPLHQLSVALVTGNEEIYRRRALPTMEYAMSREKYLFTTNEEQKIQSPSYHLKGPCVEVGELAGLYQYTKGQTPAFLQELNRVFGKTRKLNLETETGGASWQDYLARYRASGNKEDLRKAGEEADNYIKNWTVYPAGFNNDPGLRDKGAAFVTDFTPKLYDLFQLYSATQNKRYLDAAVLGARQMLLWLRSNPVTIDSIITVNAGGKVKGIMHKRYKVNSYDNLPGFYDTTDIAEERVAAWETALVGLPPEQPGTYNGGPVMLTHHAAWFLRLAEASGDTLLRDAAYNAVLGRYASFPGYYYTSFHTNVYQKANYPMHPYWDMRYNAMFYNHVFPHIALVIDFLVSDAYYRSRGQVNFPAVYAPGYAYLTSNVYGSQSGTVFGEKDVRLWLPADALQSSTVALNYLVGVGKKDTYIILMNTFNQAVKEKLRINPDVVKWQPGKNYTLTVFQNGQPNKMAMLKNGMAEVQIPAHGLIVLKIHDLKADVPMFRQPDTVPATTSNNSFFRDEQAGILGTVSGMLISMFSHFTDAYIYTDRTGKDLKSVALEYRMGSGEWKSATDNQYPFEFSVHMRHAQDKLEFRLKGTSHNGEEQTSKTYFLSNQ